MRFRRVVIVVLAAVFAGCSLRGGPKLTFQDLDGTWAREKYVTSVATSRSPWSETPEQFDFAPAAHGDYQITWTNFHEGVTYALKKIEATRDPGVFLVTDELKSFLLEVARDADGSVSKIIFRDSERSSFPGDAFVRLPDGLEPYVAGKILEGSYIDATGRHFSFEPDGTARFPDRLFHFSVSLDGSEADCPYFSHEDKDEPGQLKRYGFVWKDGKLNLYDIEYDTGMPISCAATPFAVLTPSSSTLTGPARVELMEGESTFVLVNSYRTEPPDEEALEAEVNFSAGAVSVDIPLGALGGIERVRVPGLHESDDVQVEAQFVTSYTVGNEGPHIDLLHWKHGESPWTPATREGPDTFRVIASSAPDPAYTAAELRRALRHQTDEPVWLTLPGGFATSTIRLRIHQKSTGGPLKTVVDAQLNFPLGC